MLGDVNKLLKTKSLLTMPSNVLPLHLKQTFPPIIWIFTVGEGDGIESRLPLKIFSTLISIFLNLFSSVYSQYFLRQNSNKKSNTKKYLWNRKKAVLELCHAVIIFWKMLFGLWFLNLKSLGRQEFILEIKWLPLCVVDKDNDFQKKSNAM